MKNFDINAQEFMRREKKVLEYLRGKPSLQSISRAAEEAYYNTDIQRGYRFFTTWAVAHENTILDITIAGHAELGEQENFTFLSHTLCISRDNCLLRKYHYDCECKQEKEKPIYHLQFGGGTLPEHEKYEGVEGLNIWLSGPRLFYTPMSLALIMEQAFLEFRDEDTEKIRKDGYWKGLVTASQKAILKPYFERCCNKISNNERLYSDCYF